MIYGIDTCRHKSGKKSDIPILLFHGALDPITPPSRSRSLLKQYSQIHDIVVPNKGHNVALSDCGTKMMVDFLQKYNSEPSIELIDCHQERPLQFFHTGAGHLSEVVHTETSTKEISETTKPKRTP